MVKSTAWSIRVDEIPGVTREQIVNWSALNGAVLCVREETDEETPNPHYHIAIRTLEVSQETIRNRVRKLFEGIEYSRSDYSTAVWDSDDKLLKYFSKGPGWKTKTPGGLPDVVFTNLLEATIKSFHEDFWKENSSRGKKIKKSKIDLIDEIYEKAKEHKFTNWYSAMEFVTGEFIDSMSGKVNDNVLFPLVQSVMWKLDPGSVKKTAYERMSQKFGPRAIFSSGQQQNLYEDLISHT